MELLQVAQAAQAGSLTLLGTALALGFRHGIDWDHIAAITDITSTTTNVEIAEELPASAAARPGGPSGAIAASARPTGRSLSFGKLELQALWLSSLYALGHALVVSLLGIAALYFEAILPEWVDPIMERVVGLTLLILGAWVFYSLMRYWRGEAEFRLQSRWMLVFAGIRHAWGRLRSRVHGHSHEDAPRVDQYGPKTAFGVGMIHGIGAETGSQVLIIAAVGGAASQGLGTAMMLAFVLGLLVSNTVIALLTSTGFISSSRAKSFYVAVGCLAGVFSLFVGAYFALGLSEQLPDLQQILGFIGGEAGD
jgi:cytochrome c biogenesis protein CcdA